MDETTQRILDLYKAGKSGCEIAKLEDLPTWKIYYTLEKNDVSRRSNKQNSRRYDIDHSYFHSIDSEEKAYWLGFLYADGSLGVYYGQSKLKIDLNSKDEQHLHKLRKSLSASYPIRVFQQVTTYGTVEVARLDITSDQLVEDLTSHGCHSNKSLSLDPPSLDKELERHFARGFVDGDGSIAKSGSTFRLKIVGTKSMMDWFDDILPRSGTVATHKSIWSIEAHADSIVWLYSEAQIYMDRKYDRAKQLF